MDIRSEADSNKSFSAYPPEESTWPVVILDGDQEVGAIVSMEDFALIREAKLDRFLRASEELGKQLRAAAFEEGISLEELEKMLDRKAAQDRR